MPELRPGVRLGLDWGKARIGVAACDATGTLAYPVATVRTAQWQSQLPPILAEYEPIEIVVGLPIDLRGAQGIAADFVRVQALELARITEIPIRLTDERLSTVAASRRLGQAGKDTRRQRAVIDQAAAVEILQAALDAERSGVLAPLLTTEETR